MDFGHVSSIGQRKSRRAGPVRNTIRTDESEDKLYSSTPLWFYELPPEVSISLDEFETYALDRLKLLRTTERVNMTSSVKYLDDYKKAVSKKLKELNLHHFDKIIWDTGEPDEKIAARKYDHISHYILRLPFCRTDDLRRWLISMEMDFLGMRLEAQKNNTRFLIDKYDLAFQEVSNEEKELLESQLHEACFYVDRVKDVTFYKVKFTNALDLVKSRKVFLKDGFAYIPHVKVASLLLSAFRSRFSQALADTNRMIPVLDDERIKYLLEDFDKKYTGGDYGNKKGKENCVTADMLPDLSKKSFPLCMKTFNDVLTTEYHLKHWGRLQLGLFFKGMGVPLEESVRYWRNYFTKKADIDANRFDKQYLYNIRHMYGQEGKRADYTPYNCMKVIMQSVGPGDSHGCPFRHSDPTPLRSKLVEAGIPQSGIKEILELNEKQNYHIACQKYFEWTHNQATIEGGVMHPNQYFQESQLVLQGKKSTTNTQIRPKSHPQSSQPQPNQPTDEEILVEAMEMENL